MSLTHQRGAGPWSRQIGPCRLSSASAWCCEAMPRIPSRASDDAPVTHLPPRPSRRQRGLTLIEVAMILAIAAVVIGGS
ncbi:prepilin-type N-terminal cleavage/methylation domain-containing protein [Melittangium boletus]|uniref:prepilin-type N-terminal cleavage/methylation domain-containing protein n=1 Tax=Melittangium boletus TaxID=83453 RepID=UPI003DA22005